MYLQEATVLFTPSLSQAGAKTSPVDELVGPRKSSASGGRLDLVSVERETHAINVGYCKSANNFKDESQGENVAAHVWYRE